MKILELPLEETMGENMPYLVAYLQDKMPADAEEYGLPAMVVCPGGGYTHLSPREAEPIAMAFAAKGFQTFVLYYSLIPKRFPQPLLDAAKALNLIRDHAKEWSVDPHKVAMCGFSAGGHLTAALSTLWNDPVIAQAGLDCEKARPDAAVLGYAVVMAGERSALRQKVSEEEELSQLTLKALDLPGQVNSQTPPTFLWHTATDQTVPVANSLTMAAALSENKVPFELHIFPKGPHGLALATRRTRNGSDDMVVPEAARWVDLCCDWLKRTFQ